MLTVLNIWHVQDIKTKIYIKYLALELVFRISCCSDDVSDICMYTRQTITTSEVCMCRVYLAVKGLGLYYTSVENAALAGVKTLR
jgi:hypothetical protein